MRAHLATAAHVTHALLTTALLLLVLAQSDSQLPLVLKEDTMPLITPKPYLLVNEAQLKALTVLLGVGLVIQQRKDAPNCQLNWNTYDGIRVSGRPTGADPKSCGTPRCWFGWYCFYTGHDRFSGSMYGNHSEPHTQEHFGLSEDELDKLFTEPGGYKFNAEEMYGEAAYIQLGNRLEMLSDWLENVKLVEPEAEEGTEFRF